MADKPKFKQLVTFAFPPGIARFTYLDKPDTEGQYSNGKFKLDVILEDEEPVGMIKEPGKAAYRGTLQQACDIAAKAEWGKVPKGLSLPLRDGTEIADEGKANGKDRESVRGKYITKAQTAKAPRLFSDERGPDGKFLELAPEDAPRAGDVVRIHINLFPCSPSGVKRIGTQLNSVRLMERRNRSGASAEADWGDEEDGAAPARKPKAAEDLDDDLGAACPF